MFDPIISSLLTTTVSGFTPVAWLGFLLLGFGVLIHITVVNVVLGMSVIVPVTEYIGYRRKDRDMETLAKRLFRYLALSDLVAGVFGTYVAVILAAFWPKLLYTFSTIFLGPIIIALIGIFAAIPSMAIYWYGWDRLPKRVHLGTGALMAIGALLVPAGFRVLFAFIDNPASFNVSVSANSIVGNISLEAVLTNPIYITLLFHSWFGGLTMAALFAAATAGLLPQRRLKSSGPRRDHSGVKVAPTAEPTKQLVSTISPTQTKQDSASEVDEENEKLDTLIVSKFMKYLLRIGLVFLAIQTVIGGIYFFVIREYVPYVYAAITGNTSIAVYNFVWVFVPFLVFVSLIWVSTIYLFFRTRRPKSARPPRFASFLLMLSTAAALPLGEAMNDASRAPFMILTGITGLPANDFTNTAIPITWPIAATTVAVGVFTISALLITLYIVFAHSGRLKS